MILIPILNMNMIMILILIWIPVLTLIMTLLIDISVLLKMSHRWEDIINKMFTLIYDLIFCCRHCRFHDRMRSCATLRVVQARAHCAQCREDHGFQLFLLTDLYSSRVKKRPGNITLEKLTLSRHLLFLCFLLQRKPSAWLLTHPHLSTPAQLPSTGHKPHILYRW